MSSGNFSDRLKQAMTACDMKQVDLIRVAQEQGMKLGKSHMSQYVSGKTVPRADVMRFLAYALGVTEEWLAGKDEKKEPKAMKIQEKKPHRYEMQEQYIKIEHWKSGSIWIPHTG